MSTAFTEAGYGYVNNASGTSRKAAKEQAPKTESLKAEIVTALGMVTGGATASELRLFLASRADTSSLSARLADLKREGVIDEPQVLLSIDGVKGWYRDTRNNESGRAEVVVALAGSLYDPKGTILGAVPKQEANFTETIDNSIMRLLGEHKAGLTSREIIRMSGRKRASITGNLSHLKDDSYVIDSGEIRDGQSVLFRSVKEWKGQR